jgi:hypothetical protein
MPVNWNSIPPPFQLDADSLQNFIRANVGQKFNGVVNTQTGMIFLHPCFTNVGEVDFQRNGESLGLALPLGANGGGHAWVMARVANDLLHQNDYAGFSAQKVSGGLVITVRSGLNTGTFINSPFQNGDDDEMERIMPPQWARAINDFLDATLPVPVVPPQPNWSILDIFRNLWG